MSEKVRFLKLSTAPMERTDAIFKSFQALTEYLVQLSPAEEIDHLEDLSSLIDKRIAALGSLATGDTEKD